MHRSVISYSESDLWFSKCLPLKHRSDDSAGISCLCANICFSFRTVIDGAILNCSKNVRFLPVVGVLMLTVNDSLSSFGCFRFRELLLLVEVELLEAVALDGGSD